jgi:hypothetical protein
VPGAYNPADFAQLNVSEDVQVIMQHLQQQHPIVSQVGLPL